MKLSAFLLLFVLVLMVFFNVIAFAAVSDTTQTDTTQTQVIESDTTIVFTHVDVVVETEWGEPEKNENTTAELILKDGKAEKLIFMGEQHKKCEVTVMEGLTIKIYNRKTGKLIKTIKG